MSVVYLKLPRSLYEKLIEAARREGIPANQLVTLALAEKLAVRQTEEQMRRSAEIGNHQGSRVGARTVEVEEEKPAGTTGGLSTHPKPAFDEVWQRVLEHAGETFTQLRGGRFTYEARANSIRPDRTNQNISKKDFLRAYELAPLSGTMVLRDLRGPSYLYAIIMDDRIRGDDW